MENILYQINKWILSRKTFIWGYSITLILVGLIYIIIQYLEYNQIRDSLFIGLLFGGSFILLFGIIWIQRYFIDKLDLFYFNLEKSKNITYVEFEKLINRIFNNPFVLIAGIFYGILVGCVPFILGIWNNNLLLKILLAIFLLIVNFLTGASLFSLIMLYFFLFRTSDFITVSLYGGNNTSSGFITDLSKRASIIASLYIAFCVTSIYFSELPINSLTIGYSIFAGMIILTAYIIPMIPIRNKILTQKKTLMNELSFSLQSELDKIVINTKSGDDINIEKFKSLLELKSAISAIQTIPIGFKALWNSIYIILITLLPVFIQLILEIIIK
jgi:hypothetical protein